MAKNKDNAALLKQWRPAPLSVKAASCPEGAAHAKAVKLEKYDPGAHPFSSGDKARDKARVVELAEEINVLQDMLLADKRYKVLVVLQGTDAAGKDGVLRDVFSRTSPLGVRSVGWKAPTETERAYDYLWRIHQQVPDAGNIVAFNRSHYEDVLVPLVSGQITPEQTRQR